MHVEATIDAVRQVIPDFKSSELHLNIGHESGHYFDNRGRVVAVDHTKVARAVEEHRRRNGGGLHPVNFLEDRYQALVPAYYETGRSPLPCTALEDLLLHRCLLGSLPVLDLGREGRKPPRLRVRSRRLVGVGAPERTAPERRRRELPALLDAVRGLPDSPRQSRSRRSYPRRGETDSCSGTAVRDLSLAFGREAASARQARSGTGVLRVDSPGPQGQEQDRKRDRLWCRHARPARRTVRTSTGWCQGR